MSDIKSFKGFFSYALKDNVTDPDLVLAFTSRLQSHVNAKLVNAEFLIFRDVNQLRTGDYYDVAIEHELRTADVFIALLTPSWIESDYCRKEIRIFEEMEKSRTVGEYVVPVLARSIESQEQHLTAEQMRVFKALKRRQFFAADAVDFAKANDARQKILIEKLADDIVGMIERLRILAESPDDPGMAPVKHAPSREFSLAAHNFSKIDFVSGAEVLLETSKGVTESDVYAQIDFIERLYVQGKTGRIEFGVRRAFLILSQEDGTLSEVADFKSRSLGRNTYYVRRRDISNAVSICIDPPGTKTTLAELSLPPSPGTNYHSHVAIANISPISGAVRAELRVSLGSEGIQILDAERKEPSLSTQKKIEAIMKVAVVKNRWTTSRGEIRRHIPVGKLA
jgi:hypothetical protein